MNAEKITVSPNKLDISNPYRFHGVMSIILGCLLCVIVFKSPAITTAQNLVSEFKDIDQLIDVAKQNPEQLVPIIPQLVTILFLLIAGFRGLTAILRGLSKAFSFFIPTGIPGQIENAKSVLGSLFSRRVIDVYEKPSAAMQFLATTVSSRFAFARGRCRRLFDSTLRSIPVWLLVLGLFFAPRFIPDNEDWPLPIPLAVLAAFVLVVRFIALMASVPRTPTADVHELRSHASTTGNPKSFFSHLRNALHQFRYHEFPNRIIHESPPSLGRVTSGESGEFTGTAVIETQPSPLSRGLALNAVILELGGWTVLCVTFSAILFAEDVNPSLIPYLLTIVTALIALRVGSNLIVLGTQLHEVFQFESETFEISLTGTFTSSGIGIGDGRDGQLYSRRAAIQSETYICVRGCLLRTECEPRNGTPALQAPRLVVSSTCPTNFVERCDQLLKSLENFEDTGGQLADIDVSAPSLQKIAAANIQLREVTASNLSKAELPLALPVPVQSVESGGKTCPDCGEIVKEIARKCRFCGYRFDADQDANGNDTEVEA